MIFLNNKVIEHVAEELSKKQTDSIFTDLIYVDGNNPEKQVSYWKSKPFVMGAFKKGWHPAHPTFIVKNEVYKKYGYFNLNYKLAADFELILRFLERHQIPFATYPNPSLKCV